MYGTQRLYGRKQVTFAPKARLSMRIRPQALFSVLIGIFFAFFIYEAREWRLQARLYPWAIGIPMLVLALAQLVLELRGKTKRDSSGNAPVDFQFTYTQTVDKSVSRRRTFNIFSWIFGFLVSVWLLGFPFSIPLLVFLYLKFQARERWLLSLLLTGASWLAFWGLFDRLLHLPFPEGQLSLWLGL
jgi:hypothetical protein